MKLTLRKYATTTFLPAAMLAFTACSSTPPAGNTTTQSESTPPPVQGTTTVATQKGVPGGTIVDTYKITATVTAIDAAKRKVTLVTSDGTTTTFKAGPDVVNFDQIQVGDKLKVTAARQLVVFVRKNNEPPKDGEAAAVALAPVGAKPGVLMADTVEVTATVEAIDLENRQATLLFPDGTSQAFTVRQDVDLTKAKIGEQVVIRTTEALAILVEKP